MLVFSPWETQLKTPVPIAYLLASQSQNKEIQAVKRYTYTVLSTAWLLHRLHVDKNSRLRALHQNSEHQFIKKTTLKTKQNIYVMLLIGIKA